MSVVLVASCSVAWHVLCVHDDRGDGTWLTLMAAWLPCCRPCMAMAKQGLTVSWLSQLEKSLSSMRTCSIKVT